MFKTVGLALNKYASVPLSLREDSASGLPMGEMAVDPARLFHHYYLDTRGYAPPNPDPAQFEHLALFLPCAELRVRGDGFGIGTAFRRSTSNQLGQAFCRWFLHEHLNLTYFAHIEAVLNRKPHPSFGGHSVSRVLKGDGPDYLCAEDNFTVCLAEAKGRTSPISFGSADFKSWRKQFDRVAVKDPAGNLCSVKGHIVATRFATEVDNDRIKSRLLAEDPASPGETPLHEAPGLGAAVIALHYSDLVAKIRQPILSAALALGVTVPEEIQFPAMAWEFNGPPLHGKRFVGGYFPSRGADPVQVRLDSGRVAILNNNPWRLDVGPATFFGLEESIFKGVCGIARDGDQQASQLARLPDVPFFDSGASILRDGSIIAPAHYFSPVGMQIYR
ncbi:hypothetical protein [Bradyrhizobium viridifuturi]|uniref:hypothetical protein n=1 Tax=Bradyrhizobium viridifuturi TaxID=1654716 RepID=UPI000B27995F|nr:hypothetical protein [Bradyrhizobium viridifuturi]